MVDNNADWSQLATGAYCWYNNDYETFKTIYGALYNWYAVNSGKLCPKGWHVPGDAEWTTLTTFLGGTSMAGGKMKETGTAQWSSPNTGATNESGFSGFPGGYRDTGGTFGGIYYYGYWWSSTEYTASNAWSRRLSYDYVDVSRLYYGKKSGFSIRCLRDN